jgi:hypothetical protein
MWQLPEREKVITNQVRRWCGHERLSTTGVGSTFWKLDLDWRGRRLVRI